MPLRVLAINCTLKTSDKPSSTRRLLDEVMAEFGAEGASGEIVHAADHDIRPGVTSDEGPGDAWPAIREKVMQADILVIGTPIWLGRQSSVCKRVLERMDAFLSETDERGHMPSFGKVAVAAVVGNEDGAHQTSSEIMQALNDVGFTIASNGITYWVGRAMEGVDYRDLDETPERVALATRMAARSAAHLARLLRDAPYPPMT